jgi:alanine racemase
MKNDAQDLIDANRFSFFAEVDLDAIEGNTSRIKSHLTKGVRLLAVVKDDGYGHGLLEVSRAALSGGADYLGVVAAHEGLRLELAVFSKDVPPALEGAASAMDKRVGVYIKVDTGMGRLGVLPEEVMEYAQYLAGFKHIDILGLMTHLAAGDAQDLTFTRQQLSIFQELISTLRNEGFALPQNHGASTPATLNLPESHMDMVRVGLGIYGYYPSEFVSRQVKLAPALSLRTRVIHLKHLPKGSSISYRRTYFTKSATDIAVIPVGYNHGYLRSLSNVGIALVNGRRVPVAGVVCMDMTMLDVGARSKVKVGDIVTLIGKDGEEFIGADELAAAAGTIPYELFTALNGKVPRLYLQGGQVVGIRPATWGLRE